MIQRGFHPSRNVDATLSRISNAKNGIAGESTGNAMKIFARKIDMTQIIIKEEEISIERAIFRNVSGFAILTRVHACLFLAGRNPAVC